MPIPDFQTLMLPVLQLSAEKEWRISDAAERLAINQGLEDAKAGRIRPAREFFAEFEATHPDLG
jgi:hypothetical protein